MIKYLILLLLLAGCVPSYELPGDVKIGECLLRTPKASNEEWDLIQVTEVLKYGFVYRYVANCDDHRYMLFRDVWNDYSRSDCFMRSPKCVVKK